MACKPFRIVFTFLPLVKINLNYLEFLRWLLVKAAKQPLTNLGYFMLWEITTLLADVVILIWTFTNWGSL